MVYYEVHEATAIPVSDDVMTVPLKAFQYKDDAWYYFIDNVSKDPNRFLSMLVLEFSERDGVGEVQHEPGWVIDKLGKVN